MLALAISGIACAQPQKKCFVSGGLKDEVRVYLSINGIQVAGEFFMARGYDAASREIHVFGGTKAGNNLSVKFAAGKTPDALPRSKESLAWTLVTTPFKESLQVTFYGRNYNTNKYEFYKADFESCEPSYAALAKTAQRVSFAKGASSATVSVTLKEKMSARHSFSI